MEYSIIEEVCNMNVELLVHYNMEHVLPINTNGRTNRKLQ